MAFDTTVEGVTRETQNIIDAFLSHYKSINTYGGLIKKIPSETGITDFKELTYAQYQLLIDKYKDSKTNSHCIESLFKYLYSLDLLEEKQEFGLLYGDRDKIIKYFVALKKHQGVMRYA